MNKFFTTIGLALITLAAIWGGFWLTNRSADQSNENLSLPAVSENLRDKTQQMVEKGAQTVQQGQQMAQQSKELIEKTAQMAANTQQMAEKATDMANKGKAMMENGMETVSNAAGNMVNVKQHAEALSKAAGEKLSKVGKMIPNPLAMQAESLGISHEEAALLPNLGSGWKVLAKTDKPHSIKIQELKTGMMYVATTELEGNTKRTTLFNEQTGAKVREFSSQVR